MSRLVPLFVFSFAVLCALVFAACDGSDDDESGYDDTADDDAHDDDVDDDHQDDDDADDDQQDDDVDDDQQDDDTGDDDTTPPVCEPWQGGALTSLRAGAATGDLYAPVGVSMGGYGLRDGPRHPLAVLMGGSTGYHNRLDARAVTLDNGAERVVIARIPTAMVTQTLYTKVLDRVCEQTGVGLSERLWLSATHTHSGPDHIWGLPVVFGVAGMDTYDDRIESAMAASVADVIVASMTSLEPARMAVTLRAPFDPDDAFFVDRRCQNDPPKNKEDRMFMARVDHADGTPLAVLVSWGMHGTAMQDTIMTADAPGAVETGLARTFETPVPVLFMQGAGGDARPGGSPYGHEGLQRLEYLGQTAGAVLRDIYDDLTPTDDWTFEMVAKRLRVSRQAIGYEDGEFGYYGLLTGTFYEYQHGAFGCGERTFFEPEGSIVDCDNPDTQLIDGYYGCYLPIHWVMPWSWVINTTEIGALRLGDYLLAMMPGELTSFLSQSMRADLESELDWPADKIATFGYSQDNTGYMLTEWDWLQGGYETTMNFWGPKFADWVAAENVALAGQLLTAERENNETGAPARQRHPWPYNSVPDTIEPGFMAGQTLTDASATYERFDTVVFEWSGGYTLLGSPRVSIEVQDDDVFIPALCPDGAPLTDAGIETRVDYRPDPDYQTRRFPFQRRHRWSLTWDLTADAAPGVYRIRAVGFDGDDANRAEYTAVSRSFTVEPSTALRVVDLAVAPIDANHVRVSVKAQMPPNPSGFRVRSFSTNPSAWSPTQGGSIQATINVDGGSDESLTLLPTGDGDYAADFTITQTGLPHAVAIAEGAVSDEFGNTNAQAAGPVAFP